MATVCFILAHFLGHFHQWMSWFQDHVQLWLERGSYAVLFALLFACGLGLPLPEDIPLLIGGALVARGNMHLALAAVCAWCGIIGGDCVLYSLGRKYGLEVRRLPMIGRHLPQQRIEQVHAMFEKWGVWVVAVGRMFAGIRGAMVVVAGAIRFTFWKFLLADGLAAVVSGGLFLALGYLFGAKMDWLREKVEEGKKWALLAVLIVGIGVTIWVLLRRRGKSKHDQSPNPPQRAATPSITPEPGVE